MRLNIGERFVVLSLLPEAGSFINLKLIREAREACSFDEEEHKKFNFAVNGPAVTWNVDSEEEAYSEIEISGPVKEIIISKLKELDAAEKLEERHVSLFEQLI